MIEELKSENARLAQSLSESERALAAEAIDRATAQNRPRPGGMPGTSSIFTVRQIPTNCEKTSPGGAFHDSSESTWCAACRVEGSSLPLAAVICSSASVIVGAALLRLCLTPATLKQKRRRAPVGLSFELADELQLTFGPRAREAGSKLRSGGRVRRGARRDSGRHPT